MAGRMPTLTDVARCAGVSYATADRVVNGRGGVAAKSERRVREAIETLGYVRNVAAANLSRGRTYRFAAVIPKGPNAFFAHMRRILAAHGDRLIADRVELRVETVPPFDPAALCACLGRLTGQEIDGIALVGTEGPQVADAIRAVRAAGIPVLTLVSDVRRADRDAYVGIDNRVAGRTAGRMIGLAHGGWKGRVLPIVGAMSARDHAERLAGLGETLAAHFPGLTQVPVIEGRDRSDIVEALVTDALEDDPDISAIYSAGAGNSGLIRVLDGLPRGQGRPVAVLHELVPATRRALQDGIVDVVIDQRPELEVADAIAGLRALADRQPILPADPVVPAIYVNENLPPAPVAGPNGD